MTHSQELDPHFGWNDSLTGDFLWTKTNLGEAVAETMTPLTWSVIQFTFRQIVYLPGFPTLGNLCGLPYFNYSSINTALRRVGFSQKKALKQVEDLLNLRLPEQVEIPLIRYPPWKFLPVLRGFISLLNHFGQAAREAPAYLATNREWFTRNRAKIAGVQTLTSLLNLWQEDIQQHITHGFWIVIGIADKSADFTFSLRRSLAPLVGREDADTLIANLSTDSNLLASLGPAVGLSRVVSGQMSRETYLERYGHRGPNEFEVSVPRPQENPEWLDHELSRLQVGFDQVQTLLDRQRALFEAAWARFVEHHPRKLKSMQRRLEENARLARLREQVRSEYVRDRWLVRLFALQVGELSGYGDDIFFLTLDEMLELLSGSRPAVHLIQSRKEMYRRLKALPSFPTLIRGHFDAFAWAADPHRRSDIYTARPSIVNAASTMISGSPGSAGKAEGLVRIIVDPRDSDQFQPGEILVAVQTDIAWTLLFPRAAAVVTDVGAALSHAAIVARELGIPAVVGCGDATARLKTGDRVRVDGAAGTVTVVG